MKILVLMLVISTSILFCSYSSLSSTNNSYTNNKTNYFSIPVDTIALSWDTRFFFDDTTQNIAPVEIFRQKAHTTLIQLPVAGTITHISVFKGDIFITHEDIYCCDPLYVDITTWEQGHYNASMGSCHTGGQCSFVIK